MMSQEEVIIFKNVGAQEYQTFANQAIKYALISVAFTYNRMDKSKLSARINNITKGKIAEFLFYEFCRQNGVLIDPEACSTPFWKPDNRDFLWIGGEWDIKNNYFYCSDLDFKNFDCTKLPALIPNKTHYDQWSKRNDHLIADSRFNAYVFTFMRLRPNDKNFFSLLLSEDQLSFITSIVDQHNKSNQQNMPFMDSWFFQKLNEKGPSEYIALNYHPEIIITGCANPRYWDMFKDIPSNDDSLPYITHTSNSNWYQQKDGWVSFLNGTLVTKIKNRTCPVSLLPSFSSVIKKHVR